MRRCAFLTLDDPSGYVIDDDLAYEPLRELGWGVELVPWRRPAVAWDAYEAVVIRSTWDYTDDPDSFVAVLGDIERTGTLLFNGLDLVRWNLQKTYLRDLAARGVPVVPTVWRERLRPGELPSLLRRQLLDGPGVVMPTRGPFSSVLKSQIGSQARRRRPPASTMPAFDHESHGSQPPTTIPPTNCAHARPACEQNKRRLRNWRIVQEQHAATGVRHHEVGGRNAGCEV